MSHREATDSTPCSEHRVTTAQAQWSIAENPLMIRLWEK